MNELNKSLDKAAEILATINRRSNATQYTYSPYRGTGFETLENALQYPVTGSLTYNDFLERYVRQDIAHRVVLSPVSMAWSTPPKITESDIDETVFEKSWEDLAATLSLYTEFYTVDLLSRLGRYAVLLLGVADGRDVGEEIRKGAELKYVSAIPEPNAEVKVWNNDINSERFGAPEFYEITIDTDGGGASLTKTVHWSRVVHVAQNTVSDRYKGIPALLPVYNRLIGIEKLASGSPEMYWRGARPGYVASSSGNVLATDEQIQSFKEAISDFVNHLNRYVYSEDLDVKSLAPQVVTPKEHVEVQLQLISAATRIPLRILIGSERGELSSDQDERAWLTYIESRREEVGRRQIIFPFIDRLVEYRILPEPREGYYVRWDPLMVMSDRDKAEISRLYADAIKKYDDAISARDIIPPDVFKKYILSLDDDALALAESALDDFMEEERSSEEEKPDSIGEPGQES